MTTLDTPATGYVRVLHILLLCALSLVAGCRSTPTRPSQFTTMERPLEAVHQAAVSALVVNGFDVERTEPRYLEGRRPRRWGWVSGSGGETVSIWLEPQGGGTRVGIETGETSLGATGQKNWNNDVLNALRRELERKP